MIYPDTSFLIPLYIKEEQSDYVYETLQRSRSSVLFSPFHRLELRSALRGRAFRGEIDAQQLKSALGQCDEHIHEGALQHIALNWPDILREAERLGEAHLTATGARSGDLLHVASAVVFDARQFLTFDMRQAKLARRAGLRVKP